MKQAHRITWRDRLMDAIEFKDSYINHASDFALAVAVTYIFLIVVISLFGGF